jgi:sterol desaturase/sphingolipid hydroxylase (fatty acid hydroxylase superfamily)
MHGIHHTAVREETDSNWSSGLSWWDHLHGTFRFGDPPADAAIGVPAYRSPDDVRLLPSLVLPFSPQRDAWAPPAGAAGARVANLPQRH